MKGEQTMKKSFAIIALAALVMLAGCKKNDPKPNGTRLIAGIEKHKSDSKTSLDGTIIKWSESDKLYVNNGTTPATFTLVSGAGTTTGEFATTGEYTFAAENNVAVYPNNYVSGLDNTTVTMTLPAVQTASGAGTFGNGANPMMGTFSDMDNLTLTSLCGVLCLQLTGNAHITAIEIVGGPDDKLNGTFTVDYMNPEPTYPTEGTNTVRLNFTETVTLTLEAQKFYVVVPAGTLHGFTMKVYNGDNEIFSKSTANEVPVYVNTLSTMVPVEVVPFNPLATPLTFEAREANVSVEFGGLFTAPALEYSKNGCEWNSFPGQITLENVGDIVSFRGNNSSTNQNQFSCSGQCYIYGNVMSLLHADDYATNYTLTSSAFDRLFRENTNIDIHPDKDLVLPATTLAYYCYRDMFRGCESLTKAPALPAETLTDYCYDGMFRDCTSLTTAPELPATTLANYCYRFMFWGCASLTTAPELPAETLTNSCYYFMFRGCSQLSSITCLATSRVNEENTDFWVNGVAATGTFYADPSATWSTGASGIPSGWTRLNPDGSPWVEPVPAGAINGLFSVSATQQVWFSQGNLQATTTDNGANWTWAFAANQWDYIGEAAANNSISGDGTVSENGTVDLFGWSTVATYYGINNDQDNGTYSGDFKDWGGLTIGSDAPGTWRTLTKDEWTYLFNGRSEKGVENRFAKAYLDTNSDGIGDVHGVILLPDNYTHPSGLNPIDGINVTGSTSYNSNNYNEEQWAQMEANGAVFLAAAGYRGISFSYVGERGYYWSSTEDELATTQAFMMNFSSGNLFPSRSNQKHYGNSVRLVSDAN